MDRNPPPILSGFTPYQTVREMARRVTREQFLEAYPTPGLLGVRSQTKKRSVEPAGVSSSVQLLTVVGITFKALLFEQQLAFLIKKPGNPFPNMISVGRSGNNDIVYGVKSISKLHGYFSQDDGGWLYTDHNSTNGTIVGEQKIEGSKKHRLKDGERFLFGTEVNAVFLMPDSLYDRARVAVP